MRTVYAQKNKKIILGRQGEDKAVRVVWPGIVSEWSSLYGDGSFQLSVRRFGDENAYPVVVEVNGDDISFTVTSAETAIAGIGKCELTYIANGTIAKSATWETVVLNSLTGQTPSEPPEEPAKSWFTSIQGQIGNLANLETTSKDNLVAAVNDVKQTADAKANAADLAPVATSGSYSDLFDKPTIPSVPTATIDANTAARHTHDNKTLLDSITEAVKTAWNTASEWVSTNGANVLSHLSDGVRHIAATERSAWNGKQDKLIAGENITIADDGKTISATGGGGGGASVELDTTLTQSGKAADAKAVGDALAGKQPKGDYLTQNELPDMTAYRTAEAQDVIDAGKQATLIQSGAAVGQIAKITAVDDNGKPTAWQAVDMPSGGGWELITDITLTEDSGGAGYLNVTRNDKGEDFEYRQCMVCLSGKVIDGWPKGAYIYLGLYESNNATGSNASISLSRLSAGAGGTEYKTTVEMSIFGNLARIIACGGSSDTASLIMRSDTSIDTFRSIKITSYGNNQWVVVPLAAGGRVVIYGRK